MTKVISRNSILVLLALLVLAGCRGRAVQGKGPEQEEHMSFPEVGVPAMLSSEYERTLFLAEHYWDKFTNPSRDYACDSLRVSGVARTEVEQHFANYAQLLSMLPVSDAEKAVRHFWTRLLACEQADSGSEVFETLIELSEKYFYNVNSPLRDEDLYGIIAEALSNCELVDEVMRGKYGFDAQLCALNKVGTKAADFRFRDVRGRDGHLYGIHADYVLLFFSNPGCQACKSIIERLKTSPRITEMLAEKRLAVVNMYIDEDLEAWKSYMPIYPEVWYNVYDPDYVIRTDLTYNVRAIPSLYLLNVDKTVLLKDAEPEKVFWYLENRIENE